MNIRDQVMRKEKGFTLIELVVSMGIFIVIMMVISYTFDRVYKRSGQQSKSVVTQIEGMVGLEILRTDIAAAGCDLPWGFDNPPAYTEVAAGNFPTSPASFTAANASFTAGTFDSLRDNSPNPPRAVVSSRVSITGSTYTGSDYLVLKSALLALDNQSIGKWGFVNYSSNGVSNFSYIKRASDPEADLSNSRGGVADRVVYLQSTFDPAGNQNKILKVAPSGAFYDTVQTNYRPTLDNFKPADATQIIYAYAVGNNNTLNMPYNRADFYIDFNAAKPASCNPQTGTLYKAVAGQNGNYTGSGTKLLYPLLNCVGDFKVLYYLDMNGDGNPGTYYMDVDPAVAADFTFGTNESATLGTIQATLQAPDLLRQRLKTIIIYILAHEGQKDTGFNYPHPDPNNVITIGDFGARKVWSAAQLSAAFGADWFNYRWKVYYIAVNMPNLKQ